MRNKKAMRPLGFVALLFVLVAQLSGAGFSAKAVSPPPEKTTLYIHNYSFEDKHNTGGPGDGTIWSNLPKDALPVVGVEFTIWSVDTAAGEPDTVQEARKLVDTASKLSGRTGQDGTVSFQLPNGLYYIEESPAAAETAAALIPCEPFIISLPMQEQSTGDWLSSVHVYPKRQPLFIDKFVNEPGQADYSFTDKEAAKYKPVQIDKPFGWTLISSVPNIKQGMYDETTGSEVNVRYTVTDKLSDHFTPLPDTVQVYAIPTMDTPCAEATRLLAQIDYQMSYDKETNTIVVTLTPEGLAKFSSEGGQPAINRFLMIKYDCMLNASSPQGEDLFSGGTVSYERNNVSTAAKVAWEPSVHTGQIGLTKISQDKSAIRLPGAKFGLAVSKEDAEKENFILTGVTDTQGELVFKGLNYGLPGDNSTKNSSNTSYWLVETEAPLGYSKLSAPVEIMFNHQQDPVTNESYFARVNVYNKAIVGKPTDPAKPTNPGKPSGSAKPNPQTGDSTNLLLPLLLMAFSVIGIGIAIFFLRRTRKKQ